MSLDLIANTPQSLKYINSESQQRVSSKFASEVDLALQSMGETSKKLIDAKGLDIQLCQKLSDIVPEYKAETPRGWPEGSTWDNACAVSRDGIVISRRMLLPLGTNILYLIVALQDMNSVMNLIKDMVRMPDSLIWMIM